jgi:hypothetical protein
MRRDREAYLQYWGWGFVKFRACTRLAMYILAITAQGLLSWCWQRMQTLLVQAQLYSKMLRRCADEIVKEAPGDVHVSTAASCFRG